jgi:hypothetical protein
MHVVVRRLFECAEHARVVVPPGHGTPESRCAARQRAAKRCF